MEDVFVTLDITAKSLFQWINHNFLKADPDKSHILSDNETKIINIPSESIQNILSQKLLRIVIDS